MSRIIKTTFQLRRGLKQDWETVNPLLAYGEPGFEVDTNKLKIGNGLKEWNDLEYLTGGSSISGADWDAEEGEPGYIANKPFYDASEDYDKEIELNDPRYESEVDYFDVDAPYYDDGIGVSDSDSYYNDIAALADQSCESVTIYFPGESVTLFLDDYYEEGDYRHATFLNGEETIELRINDYGAAGGGEADLYVYVNESVITTLFPMYDEPPQEEIPFGTLRITAPVKVGDVKKLDQKYVPNADWNASEGEDGYVKNRPFYEDYEVIEYDSTPLSVTFPGSDLGNGPAQGVYELPLDVENLIGPIIASWGSSQYYGTGFARVAIGDRITDLKVWTSTSLPDADSAGQFVDSDTNPSLLLIGAAGKSNYAFIGSPGTIVIPQDDTSITIELVGPVVHKLDTKYLPEPVILYGNQTYGGNIYHTQADYISNINPIAPSEFVSEKYYDAFLERRLFVVDDGSDPIPYEGMHKSASLVIHISLMTNGGFELNSIWHCENQSEE